MAKEQLENQRGYNLAEYLATSAPKKVIDAVFEEIIKDMPSKKTLDNLKVILENEKLEDKQKISGLKNLLENKNLDELAANARDEMLSLLLAKSNEALGNLSDSTYDKNYDFVDYLTKLEFNQNVLQVWNMLLNENTKILGSTKITAIKNLLNKKNLDAQTSDLRDEMLALLLAKSNEALGNLSDSTYEKIYYFVDYLTNLEFNQNVLQVWNMLLTENTKISGSTKITAIKNLLNKKNLDAQTSDLRDEMLALLLAKSNEALGNLSDSTYEKNYDFVDYLTKLEFNQNVLQVWDNLLKKNNNIMESTLTDAIKILLQKEGLDEETSPIRDEMLHILLVEKKDILARLNNTIYHSTLNNFFDSMIALEPSENLYQVIEILVENKNLTKEKLGEAFGKFSLSENGNKEVCKKITKLLKNTATSKK